MERMVYEARHRAVLSIDSYNKGLASCSDTSSWIICLPIMVGISLLVDRVSKDRITNLIFSDMRSLFYLDSGGIL